jgi:hypothetical protein
VVSTVERNAGVLVVPRIIVVVLACHRGCSDFFSTPDMSFRVDLCTFINILLCLAHDVSRKRMFVIQTPAACQPTSQQSTRCERVCEKGFSSRISYRTQHARNEIRFLVTVVHSTYLPVVWIACQNFDLAILSIATAPTNNNSGAGGSEPYAK